MRVPETTTGTCAQARRVGDGAVSSWAVIQSDGRSPGTRVVRTCPLDRRKG